MRQEAEVLLLVLPLFRPVNVESFTRPKARRRRHP